MLSNAAMCIVFIVLSVLISPTVGLADDFSLTSRGPSPLLVITPDGRVRTGGQALPNGYAWRDDGGVSAPKGLVVMPDGRAMSSGGSVPEGYARRQDGAVLAPDGIVIAKSSSQAEAAAAPLAKPKPGEAPLLALLPMTDPTPEPVEKKETPRQGEALKIPTDAAQKKDVRFLDGCWRCKDLPIYKNNSVWHDPSNSGTKTEVRICFNENGRGRVTFYDEGECKGGASARFSGSRLHMETGKAPCNDNRYVVPRSFECHGSGDETECAVIAKSDTVKRRSVVHFKRE